LILVALVGPLVIHFARLDETTELVTSHPVTQEGTS
jgi:hypothetical protein